MAKRLSKNDPNSFSNPGDCYINDIDIHLEVNFKKHILEGFVDLSVERKNSKSDLFLDTRDLSINAVKNKNTKNNLNFVLHDPVDPFGSKLEIKLPKRGTKFVVRVEYETSSSSSALMWLEPEQTAEKKHPYMFSMCQAIHARSMLPCQDTPSVKAPYTATITAPYELTVLMSAIRNGEEMAEDPMMKNYKFVQKIPIPSYLIVVVAGALESRSIGPRSHIWSESSFIDKAAEEFSETEEMLSTAEDLLGEYVWGVYDILVLPPSFAFGGMENPCLTFVTPALLAGDKSLVSVIAHEIAHSWSGNLVTFTNFEHFWLNEGFTNFFENKIIGRMHGEQYRHLNAIGNWMEMEYDVEDIGPEHEFTKLVPDLTGVDPDESLSGIPYFKGHTLLFYLETLLGNDELEKFHKAYIQEYKYKSIDTDTWKGYLYQYFSDKESVLDQVDWETWFHSPGMPPFKPEYDHSLLQKGIDLSNRWSEADDTELGQFSEEDIQHFSSIQVREFLAYLLKKEPLSVEKLTKLEELYKFHEKMNCEIRLRWIRLGLIGHWKDIIPLAIKFVTEIGRCKLVAPVYAEMYQWEETKELAVATYKEHSKSYMHPVVQRVTKILKLDSEEK